MQKKRIIRMGMLLLVILFIPFNTYMKVNLFHISFTHSTSLINRGNNNIVLDSAKSTVEYFKRRIIK